jgi:hypothetical protein
MTPSGGRHRYFYCGTDILLEVEEAVNVMNGYWCSKCNGTGKVLSELSSNMVDCPQCGFLRQPPYSPPQSPPQSANFDYGIIIGAAIGAAVVFAWVIWSNIPGSSTTSSPSVAQTALPPPSTSRGNPAAAVIDDKLSRGITPSGQDIDRYSTDPDMRKALRAFYGTDD